MSNPSTTDALSADDGPLAMAVVDEHARTTLAEDGGSLVVRNPSSAAHRLLSVAGVTKLFEIQIS